MISFFLIFLMQVDRGCACLGICSRGFHPGNGGARFCISYCQLCIDERQLEEQIGKLLTKTPAVKRQLSFLRPAGINGSLILLVRLIWAPKGEPRYLLLNQFGRVSMLEETYQTGGISDQTSLPNLDRTSPCLPPDCESLYRQSSHLLSLLIS